ncbi:MAG: TIR domain-containing protein [Ruminococcus sp.]|nr:TIR domain-containing protein [Ruminococcus sp.]
MEYKYKAFISYRHTEPDMQAAERLQKLLEAYRPPKSLGKAGEKWRIFRDVSELQSSSDLSEIIRNAIETSEFLIVICSPKYTESKWCMQELTRFRELHGNTNENIITLLVSGEPHESFPKELTYAEMTTTNEKGEEIRVKVDVEPLAANIKADTLKESMKKLNTEYLRIAAPLLGCDFNDLFQREKRREAAKRRRIFGGVSGILSLISIISIASAVTISGKNVRIKKQNDQIKEQNEQIANKNRDLLIENAGHLAVESENLFKENNLIPAIQKAVEALPADGEDKPVLPEAEYALSRELGMFSHTQILPQLSLKHSCAVEQLSFMGGGKSVVSQDATGIYFWDPQTGELIKKITPSDNPFGSELHGSANRLTAVLDVDPDKTGVYFDHTGSPGSISYENSSVFNKIYLNYAHSADEEEPGTGGDVYIYNSDSTVWRLDGATGEIKWTAPPSEKAYSYRQVKVDEEYVLRVYQDKNELPGGTAIMGDNYYLEILDRQTGKEKEYVRLNASSAPIGFLMDLDIQTVRGDTVYIYYESDSALRAYRIKDHALEAVSETEVKSSAAGSIHNVAMQFHDEDAVIASCSILAFDLNTEIIRCDKELNEKKWSTSLPVNYQNGGRMFLMPAKDSGYEHDVLAVMSNFSLSFVDYENGKIIKHIPFDSEVADASFSRSGLVMFTVKDGAEYVVSLGSYTTGSDSDNAAYLVQTMNTSLSLCSYSRNRYVTAENYSNTAYIRFSKQNPMYTDIDTGEFMYDRDVIAVSDDGGLAAVVSSHFPDGKYSYGTKVTNYLYIYDTGSGKCTEVTDLRDHKINSAAFLGKNKLIVNANEATGSSYSTDDVTMLVDTQTCSAEKVKDAPMAKRSDMKLIPTDAGAYYLFNAERDLALVSADGSCKVWAETPENSFSADREIVGGMYAVSGSRAAMQAEFRNDEEKSGLIIYDFTENKDVKLGYDFDDGLEVQHIFWQNSNTVGVFFSNRSVSLFDADTGQLRTSVSLDGTSQEPISVAPVSEDTFAVLCRDSRLYEMNAEGFTGRSCRLDFSSAEENKIREYDSSDAARLEIRPSADSQRVFVVWDDSEAWLLDKSRFTVRYRIDDFAAAPAGRDTVFVRDPGRNRIGCFPIYTTQQLIQAAKDYLRALGEA